MKLHLFTLLGVCLWVLCSCFPKVEQKQVSPSVILPAKVVTKKDTSSPDDSKKDTSLNLLVRYFEQADAIHREAWWVLTNERWPLTKSPFGKVQRALMSFQNLKLANKSAFRCDRYIVRRDVKNLTGFPQEVKVFEKCSEKIEAKLLAEVQAPNRKEVQVVFYPENLEEILGLSSAVVNKSISCTIQGDGEGRLLVLRCQHWSQDRSKEQTIRLETYDYEKSGKNLIQLRGKVLENLTEIRKIVADVPMEGKVEVLETELYPPTEEIVKPTPTPKPSPAAKKVELPQLLEPAPQPQMEPPQGEESAPPVQITPLHLPPPAPQGQPGAEIDQPEFIELAPGGEPSLEPQPEHQPEPESRGIRHGR